MGHDFGWIDHEHVYMFRMFTMVVSSKKKTEAHSAEWRVGIRSVVPFQMRHSLQNQIMLTTERLNLLSHAPLFRSAYSSFSLLYLVLHQHWFPSLRSYT